MSIDFSLSLLLRLLLLLFILDIRELRRRFGLSRLLVEELEGDVVLDGEWMFGGLSAVDVGVVVVVVVVVDVVEVVEEAGGATRMRVCSIVSS